VRELGEFKELGTALPPGLLDTARVVNTLAALDAVQQKETHQRLLQFRTAVSLKGAVSKLLAAELDISLERRERDISTLEGVLSMDEQRLSRLLVALLRDLRDQQMGTLALGVPEAEEIRAIQARHGWADDPPIPAA